MITEGSIEVIGEEKDIPSKKMHVFYNRDMRVNREISLLLAHQKRKKFNYWYYPLSGTGIRPLRTVKEANIEGTVVVNDKRPSFPKEFSKARKHNEVTDTFNVFCEDARQLSYKIKSFDFADLDPYGSPNIFLDSLLQKLRHKGRVCITATDTAPLCGTYPSTCKRKYWAKPKHGMMMKEIGLRILIRKCQLVAAQHEKALTPILCYAGKHYFKVCFDCLKSKTTAKNLLENQGMFRGAGPLWLGPTVDQDVVSGLEILPHISEETKQHVELLREESRVNTVGFFDIHKLAKKYGIGDIPTMSYVVQKVGEEGVCTRTHYSSTGIKTVVSEERVAELLKRSTN